jgi:hypothetical protein
MVKSIFDPEVKQETIQRINKLNPESPALWGKMNAGQMLAHCGVALKNGLGGNKLPRSFAGLLFGRIARRLFYGEKPYKKGLPTDKTFIMKGDKDFEKEKQAVQQLIREFNEGSVTDHPHPFFGKLTKEQWGKGTWKHLNHHLEQFGV